MILSFSPSLIGLYIPLLAKPIALLPIAKTSFLNADVCSVTFGLKKLPLTNSVLIRGKLAGRMFPGRERERKKKQKEKCTLDTSNFFYNQLNHVCQHSGRSILS